MIAGRTATPEGRELLLAAAVGAGVTLAATILAGLLIGGAALSGSLGFFRFAALVLTALPAAIGGLIAAQRATGVLDRGLPAVAVGVSGALLVVVLIGLMSLVAPGTSVVYTVASPLLGAVVGSAVGGLSRRLTRT